MTDTVNVPREMIERLIECAKEDEGCYLSVAHKEAIDDAIISLEAAPKAEPVSDPYKLDRSAIVEAVKVAMNDAWCDITSDTGCWPADLHRTSERGPVIIEYRPAIWTETTAEMVANILAQPEAPKVEQEPVAWRYRSAERPHLGWTKPEYSRRSPYGRIGMDEQPLFTHPAPASDELLEALEAALSAANDLDISSAYFPRAAIVSLIAKHKGPQS